MGRKEHASPFLEKARWGLFHEVYKFYCNENSIGSVAGYVEFTD